jgi:hypothetical protein
VRPFLVADSSQFGGEPPLELTSRRYAKEVNEVKELGIADSRTRTDDQTNAARFWGTTNATATWSAVLRAVADQERGSLADNARLLALACTSAADALITTWTDKDRFVFWRPLTAIRLAAEDGNDRTQTAAVDAPLDPADQRLALSRAPIRAGVARRRTRPVAAAFLRHGQGRLRPQDGGRHDEPCWTRLQAPAAGPISARRSPNQAAGASRGSARTAKAFWRRSSEARPTTVPTLADAAFGSALSRAPGRDVEAGTERLGDVCELADRHVHAAGLEVGDVGRVDVEPRCETGLR